MTSPVPQSQIGFLEACFVNSMAAKMWSFFVASFVIFISLKEANTKPLDTENATGVDSGRIIVKGDYYALNLYLDKGVETALSDMQKKIELLEGRMDALEKPGCKFDFEDGIDVWEKTGTAFNNQPTYGDNPTARKRDQPANQQGDWWIGGYENRPSKWARAGEIQGDRPQGTLTSPFFNIRGKDISFLIGGGCDITTVRAELIIGKRVVRKATGKCTETMTRKTWNVGAYIGQQARVRLVDFSSDGWGHINFDDLEGDISCGQN